MSNTKEKIIYLGDNLIRTKGFNGFSYKDISKELGVKNAAIHYHFPTKNDLVNAIIEDYVKEFNEFVALNQNKQETDQIKGFLDVYSKIQSESKVCLIGAMSVDWENIDDSLRVKVKSFAEKVINWLTNVLEKGYQHGVFQLVVPPRTKSLMILTNIFAAIQLAKITGKDDFFILKFAILKDLSK